MVETIEKNRYISLQNDEIDAYIGAYCNGSGLDLGFEWIQEGVYQIGEKKVFLMMKQDGLMMRRGAGFQDAHPFFDHHYKKVSKKKGTMIFDNLSESNFSDF